MQFHNVVRSFLPNTEFVVESVRVSLVPIVLFNVLDNVHSAGLQSVLEEILESQYLVVGIVGPVVNNKIQIAYT